MERWSGKRTKIVNAAECDCAMAARPNVPAVSQGAQGERRSRSFSRKFNYLYLKAGRMGVHSGGSTLRRGGVGGELRGEERKDAGVVVRAGRWWVKNGGRSGKG